MKPHTICIIPARGDSKQIPKKNIVQIQGIPLIAWSILAAKASTNIDCVYVSSDSDEILEIASRWGATPLKRPAALATDTATSESTLMHSIEQVEQHSGKVDEVIFLQATSPLRLAPDIDQAIAKFRNEQADSLFSATILKDFFVFEERNGTMESINFDFKDRKRSQDLGDQYLENGSIYVFKRDLIFNEKNRLGGKIATYPMPFWQSYKIDEQDDIDICAYYLQKKVAKSLNQRKLGQFKLFVYDFDGVMTNNRATVNEHGEESVTVNRGDGQGIDLIRSVGIEQLILSTETNQVVKARANKLKLEVAHGIADKRAAMLEILRNKSLDWEQVLYVGNDVNDLEAMKRVGCAIAPADAHPSILGIAHVILASKGGEGVIRELADLLEANTQA